MNSFPKKCGNCSEKRHGLKSEAEKFSPSRGRKDEVAPNAARVPQERSTARNPLLNWLVHIFRPLDGENFSASDFNPWQS